MRNDAKFLVKYRGQKELAANDFFQVSLHCFIICLWYVKTKIKSRQRRKFWYKYIVGEIDLFKNYLYSYDCLPKKKKKKKILWETTTEKCQYEHRMKGRITVA